MPRPARWPTGSRRETAAVAVTDAINVTDSGDVTKIRGELHAEPAPQVGRQLAGVDEPLAAAQPDPDRRLVGVARVNDDHAVAAQEAKRVGFVGLVVFAELVAGRRERAVF